MRDQAACHRLHGLQSGLHLRQRGAYCQRHGRGRQRIAHIVDARHRQRDGDLTCRRDQHEPRAFGRAAHIARTHIGSRIQAKFQYPLAVQAFEKMQRERIIGIDHGHAVIGQGGVDRAFGLRHAQQAPHAF